MRFFLSYPVEVTSTGLPLTSNFYVHVFISAIQIALVVLRKKYPLPKRAPSFFDLKFDIRLMECWPNVLVLFTGFVACAVRQLLQKRERKALLVWVKLLLIYLRMIRDAVLVKTMPSISLTRYLRCWLKAMLILSPLGNKPDFVLDFVHHFKRGLHLLNKRHSSVSKM